MSNATIDTNIIEQIIVLSNIINKLGETEIFKPNNITTLQFNILGTIIIDKAKTINDIKKRLIVSSASLSQTINRMEKAGFISRIYGKGDKREVYIEMKQLGIDTYNQCNKVYLEMAAEKLGGFSDKNKELFFSLLKEFNSSISK